MASQLAYPVKVEARLSDDLSRWLWLFKWFLAIPHCFVLAFLWLAYFAMSIAAFFAILFTGHYPRGIFAFNVGVLRWSWRVAYYAYGALGTDRYPPFTLDDVPDYPAHLEVAYPEKLSRGLVLVKWWLLAIPHYIVAGLFMGGTWIAFGGDDWQAAGFGLIGILVLVAGVALTFTGRYPIHLFDLILGSNRWVLRVAAYAGLMTDAYPPFRLDSGGLEPGGTMTLPPGGGESPPSGVGGENVAEAPAKRGWRAGPILAVVFGCLVALSALGAVAGGGFALWADTTQREGGFVTTPTVELDSDAYAIVSKSIKVHAQGPDWVLPKAILGDARIRINSETPVFVGVGPTRVVERYLGGVAYAEIPNLADRDGRNLPAREGEPPQRDPDELGFWIASSKGAGNQSITFPISNGDWSVVVMNGDASRGVDFRADVGAEAPALGAIAIGLFIAGGGLLLIAVALIAGGIVRAGRHRGPGGPG